MFNSTPYLYDLGAQVVATSQTLSVFRTERVCRFYQDSIMIPRLQVRNTGIGFGGAAQKVQSHFEG